MQVRRQRPAAAVGVARPPIAAAGFLHQRHRLVIDHRRARAHELVVAGLEAPAELAPEQVHRQRPARVRGRGQHRRGADRRLQRGGDRVGAAEVAGQYRDRPACGLVEHDHAGIAVLVLQVGGDQAHHRAERDDGDEAVEVREQRGHLRADLALVAGAGAGCGGVRLAVVFPRCEQARAGKRGDDAAGERDAVAGDRDHRQAPGRKGQQGLGARRAGVCRGGVGASLRGGARAHGARPSTLFASAASTACAGGIDRAAACSARRRQPRRSSPRARLGLLTSSRDR